MTERIFNDEKMDKMN